MAQNVRVAISFNSSHQARVNILGVTYCVVDGFLIVCIYYAQISLKTFSKSACAYMFTFRSQRVYVTREEQFARIWGTRNLAAAVTAADARGLVGGWVGGWVAGAGGWMVGWRGGWVT